MSRRAIYECVACCDKHCTVRTYGDTPPKCLYWMEKECWVRKDKHEQKQLSEFRPSADPTEDQELAGLGWGLY